MQGVGFRWQAREAAQQLGLNGWVRNLADGRVELVAEGEDDLLEELMHRISTGPLSSYITDYNKRDDPYRGDFSSFDILF